MDGNQKFYGARIVQRRDIAADLWSIRVQRDAEFHFLPGQYATLGVLAPHKHIERPYSIVSSPYESELEFFFELVPRGELTPALHKLNVVDELIRKYTHLWELMPETTSAYLCGHPKMIDNSSGILVRRGWAKEHIKEEIYFVPKEHATAI